MDEREEVQGRENRPCEDKGKPKDAARAQVGIGRQKGQVGYVMLEPSPELRS